ncbi:MAG: BMC domain-containing protein [Treponema sp.]|jgi:microcompartment protein CcmL/EutN|nr:BMC domain-containing protein [Treponema sp.]
MDTIGFLELSSIAGGVEIVDSMLKVAQIELLFAKASCPGKYYILIAGQVSNVEKAIQKGVSMGGGFVVASLVLPRVHPQVIKAINQSCMPEKPAGIGVMEFYSVMSSILAADTAVKAANVELIDIRLGTGIGGKSFVVITGETSAVNAAMAAAVRGQLDSGMLVNQVSLANPRKEVIESLF